MKLKGILYAVTGIMLAGSLYSCKDSFLDENPLDFMGGGNSFETYNDFECSVNNLYYLTRREFYSRDENRPMDYIYGCDLVYDGEPNGTERHSNMIAAYDPTGNIAQVHWMLLYKIISEANTIIGRLPNSRNYSKRPKPNFSAVSPTALWHTCTEVYLCRLKKSHRPRKTMFALQKNKHWPRP